MKNDYRLAREIFFGTRHFTPGMFSDQDFEDLVEQILFVLETLSTALKQNIMKHSDTREEIN